MGYNSKVRQKDKQKQTVREIKLSSLKKISLFITNILIVSLAPKWLSVLGIAFILPTFLYAWFSLKDLLDIYFPVKTKFYKYKHTELFFVTFFTFSLISMLILFEDDVPFSNTPMLISIGIGLLFCLMILIILPYLVKGIFSSSMRRFTIFSTCVFSFPFLTMGTVDHLNIALAKEELYCENILLLDKSTYEHDNYDAYRVHFVIENKELYFEVPQHLWNKLNFGDLVEICYIHGYFGYDKIALIEQYNPKWDSDD